MSLAVCVCVIGWDRIVCSAGKYSKTACVRECKIAVEKVCKDVDPVTESEQAITTTVHIKRVMQILLGQEHDLRWLVTNMDEAENV